MSRAAGTFRRPFAEQVAAFRVRLQDLRPTRTWLDLWQADHDRAFMVAGAMKADLLADLAAAVEKAIAEGTGIEAFRRDFREIVERRGWHGWTGEGTKRGEAWRTRVIYRTNMSTSYAAGRWAQLMKAGFPLLIYRHGGSLEPRLQHLDWDGLVLPADHPFWVTHAPPNGWGCSCYVIGAWSMRDAIRTGGNPGKVLPDGWAILNPRTGAPDGIDKGWAYAPGATVAQTISQIAGKLQGLPGPIGAELAKAIPQVPPPPPADKPLNWREWPKHRTLEEVRQSALQAGVADNIILRKSLPVSGTDQYLRLGAEVTQRFGLPPLTHFSYAADLPFTVRGAKHAAAFYVPARKSMGIKPKGVNSTLTKAAFDHEELPSNIAKWYDELMSAAQEVQRRAGLMQPRRWSVVRDVRDVAAHEWGHHLHYSLRRDVDALVRAHDMIGEGWPKLVSRYSDTNVEEFIAESFALYIQGDEAQYFRLHPELLAFFRRKDQPT